MLTIFILLASFKAGCPGLGFAITAILWALILCGRRRPSEKRSTQDPIDKYGDEHYADIDWLRNGKL